LGAGCAGAVSGANLRLRKILDSWELGVADRARFWQGNLRERASVMLLV